MNTTKKTQTVEWMCTRCGSKTTRSAVAGRPMPGRCSRSVSKNAPHRWVKNKTY